MYYMFKISLKSIKLIFFFIYALQLKREVAVVIIIKKVVTNSIFVIMLMFKLNLYLSYL